LLFSGEEAGERAVLILRAGLLPCRLLASGEVEHRVDSRTRPEEAVDRAVPVLLAGLLLSRNLLATGEAERRAVSVERSPLRRRRSRLLSRRLRSTRLLWGERGCLPPVSVSFFLAISSVSSMARFSTSFVMASSIARSTLVMSIEMVLCTMWPSG